MILDTDKLDADDFDSSHMKALVESKKPILVFCDQDEPGILTSLLKIPHVEGAILTVPEEKEGNCMLLKQELKARGVAVDTFETAVEWEQFKLDSQGLIPVVVQDYKTLQVLMVAYMNEEAFSATLKTGRMTYFSSCLLYTSRCV